MKKLVCISMLLMLVCSVNAKTLRKSKHETYVTLTTYSPSKSQCDKTPLVTADGTKINLRKLKNKSIRYCAVSRNLLKVFPYGTKLYIEGEGVYEVRDTMNSRYSYYIDILQHSSEKKFKKHNVKVTKL